METKQVSNIELLNEIKKLQIQIINLEQKINNTNELFVNHINFINNVFDKIKQPLFFIMNKVNSLLQLENIN